jgi:diguanylate cyclase (GGDEF)-like protein/PAS domain S-box-containing protein
LLAYPEVGFDEMGRPLYTYGALQDITERKQAEQSLLQVARAVTATSSETFFPSLVEHLARALEADYAFVGALAHDNPDQVHTIAVQANGHPHDNFEYSLRSTPCANVIVQGTCAYSRDVQQLFPDDPMLAEMGVHAYVGTPMQDAQGKAMGLIVVLFRRSIDREQAVASTLEIFAARATSELQRLRAEAQMRKLSSAIEQTADAVMITDRRGVIEYINPAFERSTGFTPAEALGQTPRLVRSGKQGQSFYRKLWSTILAGDVFSDVLINRRKDGTFYYEEKTITPLKDADGRITHFISTGKDVTERMQAQEKLEFMAQHDALTELPNRALLLDRLKQSIARARWHRRMVAVLFLDLDRFKTINDTLGHEAGDQLLQQLGGRFSRSVREGDTVARFGGDEFVILLDDVASDKDIGAVAQKVLDTLKAPFEIAQQHLYITASIGVSLFPNDGEDGATLLKHSDVAMYRAKEMGKNTYQFYSADMSARAFERLSLENSLRHALERHEFVLHYQPQYDVQTGRMFGVEALLRWQHPDFGLVPPADFIALLEETGLIVPAGEWVLEEAARQLHNWHAAGHRHLRLAVNLSPRQVQSGGLLGTVQRVLNRMPDESGWLELEITESLLVQQSQMQMETFESLRALGVRLAIDDFGTGYSSLSYLRRLPIDTLKIDRSFVRDVPGDADDSAITTTIIAMAQSLRLEVVAEGVENAAQRDFLSAYGCWRMQGYLFARPMPAAELTRLLAGGGSISVPG